MPEAANTRTRSRDYPRVDHALDSHQIEVVETLDLRYVVTVDGLHCPHLHRTRRTAERCLWKWNDIEVARGQRFGLA